MGWFFQISVSKDEITRSRFQLSVYLVLFLDRKGGTLWPLAVYLAIVIALVAGMSGLSFILGQRHSERATSEPYEGGVVSTGSAHVRLSAQSYLVAMFFVIFDLEAVFIACIQDH